MRCPRCGAPAYMGKACKPKNNPTKQKENNHHCPLCGWAENQGKKKKMTRIN